MAAKRKLSAKERRHLYYLVHRIYWLLENEEWRVRFARIRDNKTFCDLNNVTLNCVGYCDHGDEVLCIDHRFDLLATLLHECMHAIYYEKKEREIIKLEKFLIRNITPIQAKRILLLAMRNMD